MPNDRPLCVSGPRLKIDREYGDGMFFLGAALKGGELWPLCQGQDPSHNRGCGTHPIHSSRIVFLGLAVLVGLLADIGLRARSLEAQKATEPRNNASKEQGGSRCGSGHLAMMKKPAFWPRKIEFQLLAHCSCWNS